MQKSPCLYILQILLIVGSLMSCREQHASELNVLTEYLPPLNYEQDGVITGYATELLQAMLEHSGIKAKFSLMPWARAYQTALAKPNTLIYSMTRLPERENLFEWIGPINHQRTFLFKLRSRKDISAGSMQEVSNYTVGLVRETASTKRFITSSGVAKMHVDYAPTIESNIKKLLINRVDLIPLQKSSAVYYAKALHLERDDFEEVLLLEPTADEYFALSKPCDPETLLALRNSLDALEQSGKMEQLKDKYLR